LPQLRKRRRMMKMMRKRRTMVVMNVLAYVYVHVCESM
jgi:hypothetical protein